MIKHSCVACIVAVALTAGLCGCSNIYETHYFKSETGNPPNFYRLQITGNTILTSSRYVSGYFDEQAVDNYFGEFTQPTNGHFSGATTNIEKVVSIDGQKPGTTLLLLLSANSDAIADQIGAMAKSSDLASSIGTMLSGNAQTTVQRLQTTLQLEQTRAKALAQMGDTAIMAIDTNMANKNGVPDINQNLLAYVNAIATELGNQRPFNSFDEAAQWLQYNRAQLYKAVAP